jgi:hypothetical protein
VEDDVFWIFIKSLTSFFEAYGHFGPFIEKLNESSTFKSNQH